ncbi:MAG: gamma-glutamyltransferase, partial [Chloroflexi bacterium]|nr:gamma-glutamyltransferase [Chloroflexota bacterium]
MSNSWKDKAGSPFDTYKRGAVASRGMVSSNHPMASAAGLEMLAMGGNAIDAAVATAFALTVVEPMMIGIFGAGFINFYNGTTGEFVNIDNYAIAPKAATADMFEPISDDWPDYMETVGNANSVGYRSVGVPGALMGWCHAEEEYGRLGLDTVIQPAIRYAQRGFPASQYLVDIIDTNQDDLARFPASAEIFLPGGSSPSTGQIIVRTDYARTLRAIAEEGPDVLYHGSIGEMVVDDMAANAGIITGDDLESYEIRQRQPVRQTYRDCEIVSVAPTSSGGTHIIQVLNLLEGFDIAGGGFGTAENVHLIAEALKIAFADRFEYMGDPAFVEVPVDALTSKEYAAIRSREIDPARAGVFRPGNPSAYVAESKDTTHLTVADDDGNKVFFPTLNKLLEAQERGNNLLEDILSEAISPEYIAIAIPFATVGVGIRGTGFARLASAQAYAQMSPAARLTRVAANLVVGTDFGLARGFPLLRPDKIRAIFKAWTMVAR